MNNKLLTSVSHGGVEHVDVRSGEADAVDAVGGGHGGCLANSGPDSRRRRVGHATHAGHPVVRVVIVGSHGDAFPKGRSFCRENIGR